MFVGFFNSEFEVVKVRPSPKFQSHLVIKPSGSEDVSLNLPIKGLKLVCVPVILEIDGDWLINGFTITFFVIDPDLPPLSVTVRVTW